MEQMAANGEMLTRLSLINLFLGADEISGLLESKENESSDELSKDIATLRQVRRALKVVVAMDGIVYGVLNTYILPLLCALLGAAAYVDSVRSPSRHWQERIVRPMQLTRERFSL